MKLKTFKNLSLKNKKVLLRVNFDVPIKNGKILDDSRIKAHLPTIFYLIKKKAKVILISHLSDPFKNKRLKIKNKKYILKIKKQYSLKPIYKNLKSQFASWRTNLKFINDCLGEKVKKEIEKLKAGEVILLENLRFYPAEEKNDKKFAKKLAHLAEIYINDAFPVCHRAHTSVSAITRYLPSYAGFLLEKEVKNLSQVFEKPQHPFIVLLGGAKISTKLPVIKNLLKKADKILVGGAIANTFLKAQRFNLGQSLYEKERIKEAKNLLRNISPRLTRPCLAGRRVGREKIVLPIDVKIKSKIKNLRPKRIRLGRKKSKLQIKIQNVKLGKLKKLKNFKILDIGQETIELFTNYLKSAKMIVWNGPMGYFEEKPFDQGTKKIIKEILANKRARIIIGGGETLAALRQARINTELKRGSTRMFISMGGGAMLEFLSGKILPGIKPLLIKNSTF